MGTEHFPEASPSTEHAWLAEGIRTGQLREKTASEIMKLLDEVPSEFNDLPLNKMHNLDDLTLIL